jgi:hypothetical protein
MDITVAAAAAIAATVVLAALAVFQVALAVGAPLGRFAWGGQHTVLPRGLRIGSAASVVLYGLIGATLLSRAGVIDWMSPQVASIAAWVVVAYFALGVVMNAISRSKPERNVMTPTVLVLAVLSLLVALS